MRKIRIPKSYFLSDRIGKHPEKPINKRSAANLSRLLELEKKTRQCA